MDIRNLRDNPDAIAQIAQWHFDEWDELYPHKTLADFAHDLRESLGATAIPQTWLLIENGEICGTASVLEHDMTINRELSPWLANIFIRQDKRGMGLGKAFVQQVMDEIKKLGVRELYLFTEDQQAFYEKLGWSTLKNDIYEGQPVVVMQHRFD